MQVNSHNEWDTLKEVIVGVADSKAYLTFPTKTRPSQEEWEILCDLAERAFPKSMIDEENAFLESFCGVIETFGAKVHRPEAPDIHEMFSTPNWSSTGINLFNVRDLHLVVGDTIIESPSPMKHRHFEPQGLAPVFYRYFDEGFKWICAPRPRLAGEYRVPFYEDGKKYHKLTENEIMFEAANTVRMGRDLLYLVSGSGNYLGAKWLQSILGEDYRVHTTEGIYRSAHIDSTVLCLRPGLVLLNGHRVNEENCPKIFDTWEKIYLEEIEPYPPSVVEFYETVWKQINAEFDRYNVVSDLEWMATEWAGLNLLSLDQNTVVVDDRQKGLIDILEKKKFTVIPLSHENQYLMKGGFHCCTLDVVRESKLESYF